MAHGLRRGISLLYQDIARLHRKMRGIYRVMRTPYRRRFRVHETRSAVDKD
jgi:hypothetical protein